jgi:hypothetical protein
MNCLLVQGVSVHQYIGNRINHFGGSGFFVLSSFLAVLAFWNSALQSGNGLYNGNISIARVLDHNLPLAIFLTSLFSHFTLPLMTSFQGKAEEEIRAPCLYAGAAGGPTRLLEGE